MTTSLPRAASADEDVWVSLPCVEIANAEYLVTSLTDGESASPRLRVLRTIKGPRRSVLHLPARVDVSHPGRPDIRHPTWKRGKTYLVYVYRGWVLADELCSPVTHEHGQPFRTEDPRPTRSENEVFLGRRTGPRKDWFVSITYASTAPVPKFDPLVTRLRHDRTYLRLAAHRSAGAIVAALRSRSMADKAAALAATQENCWGKCDWSSLGPALFAEIENAPAWTGVTWRNTFLGSPLVTAFEHPGPDEDRSTLAKPGWRRHAARALLRDARSPGMTRRRMAALDLLRQLPGIELRVHVQKVGPGKVRFSIPAAELTRVRCALGLPPAGGTPTR